MYGKKKQLYKQLLLHLSNYTGDYSSSIATTCFLLYVPQALHIICGIIRAPHLLHLTRLGADIFQFACLLSLLAFDDLFFGQMDMVYTSLQIRIISGGMLYIFVQLNRTFSPSHTIALYKRYISVSSKKSAEELNSSADFKDHLSAYKSNRITADCKLFICRNNSNLNS